MALTFLEIEDRYRIKKNSNSIEVSLEIGDAQTGAYLIFLNRQIKGVNKTASLGKAEKLINKRCVISTTIVDERDETNWTSVTVFVKEGNSTTKFGPYSKEVSQHLDTVCYVISILFQH